MDQCGLRGLVKGFWIFAAVVAVIMFVTNVITQFLLNGEIDFQRAITISISMGIVLSILMVTGKNRYKTGKKR